MAKEADRREAEARVLLTALAESEESPPCSLGVT